MAEKKNKKTKPELVGKVVETPVITEEPKAVETPVEIKEDAVETAPVEEPKVEAKTVEEPKVEDVKKDEAPVAEKKITTPNSKPIKTYRHYYNYVWNGMMYD